MTRLRLGLSPCPNDTFIFHALLHGRVDTGDVAFEPVMEDVEGLNAWMLEGRLPVTKGSFAALARARDRYAVLETGGALGRGNGPLLVAAGGTGASDLAGRRVLVPGHLTTAALLLRTFHPEITDVSAGRYDELLPRLLGGEADAAVIIHELRFTYHLHGLTALEDLGARFEEETGLPVPLGGIFVRRDVDPRLAAALGGWIAQSLAHARAHPEASREFVRAHAQELEDTVTDAHIGLYVNEFSTGYGDEGRTAIRRLLALAEDAGALPACDLPVFVGEPPAQFG